MATPLPEVLFALFGLLLINLIIVLYGYIHNKPSLLKQWYRRFKSFRRRRRMRKKLRGIVNATHQLFSDFKDKFTINN